VYCCFGCLSLGEQRRQEDAAPADPDRELGALGVRLGISILVVAQSMIFGLALNLHDDVPETARRVAQLLILCGTLLVVALLGPPLFRTAWEELRRGRLTIEALFLLTMGGAMAASLQAFATGRGKIYFEVVSVLLVVYTLGKVIGARSRTVALAGARAWAGQLAACRLVTDGGARLVPVAEVQPGDVVEVNPGETIAVDGVIRSGVGFVAEAAVSGEPFAVVRRPGDRVLAGAASHDAAFLVEATNPGTERQVDRLLAAVEQARDRPVSLQARADALGRWFFPLVVLTAIGTFGYWTFLTSAGWEAGLFNAMSVLLVACPCVIGLATPIMVWSALARLAERGVIVRAGDAVERLAAVDRVMFDKTGTLTDDSFSLLDIATVEGVNRGQLLGWLAAVESRSNHPVARAFAGLPRAGDDPRVVALKAISGCGVAAEIGSGGERHELLIGNPEWIAESTSRGTGILAGASTMVPSEGEVPQERIAPPLYSQLRAAGHRIDVALDGELVAVAVVGERLRDSTAETLSEFRRVGLPVEVLTGDTTERAAALGLPAARGGLLPDDKRAAVEQANAAGGRPLFVGDGLNDAAALAAAHAGVALASGTDLAVGAADVTLYHSDLRVLPWAVELSRAAVRSLRRNLCRAVCYNLVGMTLAACGLLHPVAAIALMTVASLSLVFSSTRVGVSPAHCGNRDGPPNEPASGGNATRAALCHGLAFALQGVAFLLLLDSARTFPDSLLILGGFALAGFLLARWWLRRPSVSHALDMCFGMLTLGNLGMLLGWWADNGFTPIHDAGCYHCVEAMRAGAITSPWMWVLMVGFANAAMRWLPRTRGKDHTLAMFTGGNVGMVLGMAAGGWCAAQIGTDSVPLAVVLAFLGMTAGMLGGMLLGTRSMETLLRTTRAAGRLRWSRAGYRTK
jgi:heavy metal translocating P-type ATPase